MSATHKYVKNTKVSEPKIRELLKYFTLDLDAQAIALLTKLNRNTVTRYMHLIRNRIAELWEEASPFQGGSEVDESYFGAKWRLMKFHDIPQPVTFILKNVSFGLITVIPISIKCC